MNMKQALADMIPRRRSVRAYLDQPVESAVLTELMAFIGQVKRLYEDIPVEVRLLDRSQVTTTQRWTTPHVLAVFSKEEPGWLENAGFMLQQADLYLQSIGLGSCWVGLGWPDDALVPAGMKHVILMPFGYAKDVPLRDDVSQFRRKTLAEIADRADERLEAVRIAPSATNSQPWYFTHEGERIHVYREELGIIKRRTIGRFNQMDMGIALAHLYLTWDAFSFTRLDTPPELPGYIYIGTVEEHD